LSVVIPAYNEERRIGPTLEAVLAYLAGRPQTFEVLVVDDHSQDRTAEIVDAAAAREPRLRRFLTDRGKGKGAAVRAGMLAARGGAVLFSDADLSTPIEEVAKLLESLEKGYDIAIASRALPESVLPVRQPLYREAMGRVFNLIIQALALPGIHDSQCGFKLFRRGVIRPLFGQQTIDGWAFDVEILFLARKYGFRIKEAPVVWVNSPDSHVDPIRDSLRMLREVGRVRLTDWLGRYLSRSKLRELS
jgi:dolichyl-phosphate beta-glucosyltransferase